MKTLTFSLTVISSLLLLSASNTWAQNSSAETSKETIDASLFFSLQESVNGFTDQEVIKLVSYIKELEKRNPSIQKSNSDTDVTEIVSKNSAQGNYFTDSEIIKLVKYIQHLETSDLAGVIAAAKE